MSHSWLFKVLVNAAATRTAAIIGVARSANFQSHLLTGETDLR